MTAIEIPTPDPRTFDETARPFAEAVSAHFAVKRMIGRGGMGMVFLARDRRLDRLVAIKTLPPTLARDPAMRERFLRETRTAGGLAHANIVPIHGADEIDGHAFFVMSYVDGASLAVHVRTQGKLEPRAVGRYLRDVAAALVHAHARGIIHRDIKAENILIEGATDRALVTDFGIARLAEATPLTISGQLLGTVHYMSPEQVSGEVADARSDIYSLGVVGFLALTGRFPFNADVASAVLVQHVTRSAPPVASVNRDVPSAIASIIDRCLMKDPAHRYASADELHAAIESALPALDQKPVVVSDTDAHSVWRLASELQAHTGVQPRPEGVPQRRPVAAKPKRAIPSTGFQVGDVIAAASEAGIDERYVERALAAHGLSGRRQGEAAEDSRPVAAPKPVAQRTPFWAFERDTALETQVDGEFPARDIVRLIDVLREQTGTMGTTVARTRELAWNTGTLSSRLAVSVVPADGRTTITMARSMRRRVIAAIVASAVAIGFMGGLLLAFLVDAMAGRGGDEIAVFTGIVVGTAIAITAGSVLVRTFRTRAAQRLRALGDVIATKIRESLG